MHDLKTRIGLAVFTSSLVALSLAGAPNSQAKPIEVPLARLARCCPPTWNGDEKKCLNLLLTHDAKDPSEFKSACASLVGPHWLVNPTPPQSMDPGPVPTPVPAAPSATPGAAPSPAANALLDPAEAEAALLDGAPDGSACYLDYLKSLGWRVAPADSSEPSIQRGNPCAFETLGDAQSHGDLQIRVPVGDDDVDLSSLWNEIPKLVLGQASSCAYKFKVKAAALRATSQMDANQGLAFTHGHYLIDIGGGSSNWRNTCYFDKSCPYTASGSNSAAIEAFYRDRMYLDCSAGLQAAQYSTLYELFGASDFNDAFKNDEIRLSNWKGISGTGALVDTRRTTGKGLAPGELSSLFDLGPQALIGVGGYIGNVLGEDYLDNKPNRGENFMFVDVSRAAAMELRDKGGLGYFNRGARRFWELSRTVEPHLALSYAKKLKNNPKAEPEQRLDLDTRSALLGMRDAISGAAFREIKVWVHPLGVMTLADHLTQLLEFNPRTPYDLRVYYDPINVSLYHRFANYYLTKCSKASKPADDQ